MTKTKVTLKQRRMYQDIHYHYADIISELSCPIDKLHNYVWVKKHIQELNPYKDLGNFMEIVDNIIKFGE